MTKDFKWKLAINNLFNQNINNTKHKVIFNNLFFKLFTNISNFSTDLAKVENNSHESQQCVLKTSSRVQNIYELLQHNKTFLRPLKNESIRKLQFF